MNIAEKDRFGGGLVLSPEQLAWVKEIIDKYGVKGWYQGDNGNRYYFTPEGEMIRIRQLLLAKINTLSMKVVLQSPLKVQTMDELSLSTQTKMIIQSKKTILLLKRQKLELSLTITIKQKLRRLISTRRIKKNMRLYRLMAKLSINS